MRPIKPEDLSWQARANCIGVDPDLFFPAVGETEKRVEALAVCRRCWVRKECFLYAHTNEVEYGIWGGHAPRTRTPAALARMAAKRPA
jgi:WhiB family redox-sensing transcriptional regulator